MDLDDIQGDIVIGLQKDFEAFVFFKITDRSTFKQSTKLHVVNRITSAQKALRRDEAIARRKRLGQRRHSAFPGLNLGFTIDGITELLGVRRPKFEPAFERGAGHPDTISALRDPEHSKWLKEFIADRIDGIFLITGHDRQIVSFYHNRLLRFFGAAIKIVYSEIGAVRPGRERGREHFGFYDGLSQPGIRGLAAPTRPSTAPDQGLPGQDLVWPGEFLLGYPSQDPKDPRRPGPIAPLPAPWARNGSYMVFRRLEQRVPEFRAFVTAQAARLGIDPELLASRMIGRWRSGAPLELAPLTDNPGLASNDKRNNDFGYADDPFQFGCPYAAHIRKVNPRDDAPGGRTASLTHRIMRAGIPFGPEVEPGETRTRRSRGLMFVCYQASIENQFEFIQRRYANDPDFVTGKKRPDSAAPVSPGHDPIIGQTAHGWRVMDEPASNYPYGNRRTMLEIPEEFVRLTAAGYFFMPSITALRTALAH